MSSKKKILSSLLRARTLAAYSIGKEQLPGKLQNVFLVFTLGLSNKRPLSLRLKW